MPQDPTAFSLPTLPFPTDANGIPYIASKDDAGKFVGASGLWQKKGGLWVPVGDTDELYVQAPDGKIAGLGTLADTPVADAGAGGAIALLKGLQQLIGIVGANPAPNTLQERFKQVQDYLMTIESETYGIGQIIDAPAASGNGTLIAITKQLRAILTDVWNATNHTVKMELSGRNLSLLTETLLLALLKETTSGAGVVPVAQVAENALDSLDNKKVNITRREPTPIQTHSAVTVALSGSSSSSIQTAYGFDSVAVGIRSDASHLRRVEIEWYADSAGSSLVEIEIIVASATKQYGAGRTTVKAGYFKVALKNEDAGAAHVMSSWTTLMP